MFYSIYKAFFEAYHFRSIFITPILGEKTYLKGN